MKALLAGALTTIVATAVPATSVAAEFSQNTRYVEEVLSVAPYRIKYVLSGQTRRAPNDFSGMGLDGQSTFVYALANHPVMVHSDGLYIGSATTYFWPFRPFVNTDPSHPVSSVTSVDGHGFGLIFGNAQNGQFALLSEFVVELKPGFSYDSSHVRMQAVYLSVSGSPFIDVFTREP
jgi:hypothetical protein